MNDRKKELKPEYKQTQPPRGVDQIRHLVNDKALLGATLNLPGVLNRHKFQLQMGGYQNKTLQAEWREFGEQNFAFEILDELAPREDPAHDYRADWAFLEALRLEQVQPDGARGYNEKKQDREARLRMIARNRAGKE